MHTKHPDRKGKEPKQSKNKSEQNAAWKMNKKNTGKNRICMRSKPSSISNLEKLPIDRRKYNKKIQTHMENQDEKYCSQQTDFAFLPLYPISNNKEKRLYNFNSIKE